MNEVVIRFTAKPGGSPYLVQVPGHDASMVNLNPDCLEGFPKLKVKDVLVDYTPHKFREVSTNVIAVWPIIPLHGKVVSVYCVDPSKKEPPRPIQPVNPIPADAGYGLQTKQ